MSDTHQTLACGYGNFINAQRLIAVVSAEAAPSRRLVQEAREEGRLIDASAGRKTRSILVMDSDQIVLSALPPEKLGSALGADDPGESPEEEEGMRP